MDKAELKHFGKSDEVREFPKGRLELIKIGGATIGRAVFEPGWRRLQRPVLPAPPLKRDHCAQGHGGENHIRRARS